VRRRVGGSLLFTVYCGGVVFFVVFFHLRYHEPWRDETQAVLIARALTPANLMDTLRHEAHPPLLHILLKALDAVTRPPLTLAIMAGLNTAVLLYGTHALLRVLTRTERTAMALTILLTLTYFYTYELGVVVRAYGRVPLDLRRRAPETSLQARHPRAQRGAGPPPPCDPGAGPDAPEPVRAPQEREPHLGDERRGDDVLARRDLR
jgi:hypothetical protein